MATWNEVPEEIKKRFPAPPKRESFANEDEYQNALGFWQNRVGRNLGLVMQQHHAQELKKYVQCAKMLVPKFVCEDDNGCHIQWPKDEPLVVYASNHEELILALAKRLQKLGRVSNAGKHVRPENGCPNC